MRTDKNFNVPLKALKPDGTVVSWPVSSTGALRIEVIKSQGTVTAPTGNENAKQDANFNSTMLVVTPGGETVMARVGPVLKRLMVEFK
jgi:hypothetical protein